MVDYLFHPYLRWLRDRSESDRPDFEINRNGSPPWPPVYFPILDSDVLTQSAPPTDLANFVIEQPNEVPGFRVRLRDEVPGFNLKEHDLQHPETTWPDWIDTPPPESFDTAQTLPVPPGVEEPDPPTPQPPEWLRNVLAMPVPQLSTAFDPQTGRRIVPYEPLVNWTRSYPSVGQNMRGPGVEGVYAPEIGAIPGPSPLEAPAIKQWTPPVPPASLADINTCADFPLPMVQEAGWKSWPQPLKDSQSDKPCSVDAGDPWNAVVRRRQQQTPFPQEQRIQPPSVQETTFDEDPAGIQPTPLAEPSPIEHSVYRPDIDPGYDELFDLVGVGENRVQGDAARDAETERLTRAYPDAPFAREIRLYAKDVPGYMKVDVMFRPNGTSMIMIFEVKSGNAVLSPQQLRTLAEAARTGNVYIVNEEAAKKFGLRPYETFASKRIIPFVYVTGGNRDAIIRQLNKLGIDATPEKTRRGQVPRLKIGRPL